MKKVASKKTVAVTGLNLLGDEIEYEFELMSANVGIPLFHEHMVAIAAFCQEIGACIYPEKKDGNVASAMMTAHHCLKTAVLSELGDKLLKGVKKGEPIDNYAALYHALYANFGATIPPLLEALDKKQGKTDDTNSTPAESETQE